MSAREEVLLVIYRPGPSFLVLLRSPESPAAAKRTPLGTLARSESALADSDLAPNRGYWHLVAGGIEEGEAPDAAALRELAEETALTQPARFSPIPLELGYRPLDDDMWVTLHPYSVEVSADWEPVLNEEHVEYRWCSEVQAEELLEYPEPLDALRQVVRQLEVGT